MSLSPAIEINTTILKQCFNIKPEPIFDFLFRFVLQPLKWELKQKPGMSPPRGGFKPDDPNQQIVAEDIFDEYGGDDPSFT